MILSTEQIKEFNKKSLTDHQNELETLQNKLIKSEKNIVNKIASILLILINITFQIIFYVRFLNGGWVG